MSWASFLPIFSFPCLLFSTYGQAQDRQTDGQADTAINALWGEDIIIIVIIIIMTNLACRKPKLQGQVTKYIYNNTYTIK